MSGEVSQLLFTGNTCRTLLMFHEQLDFLKSNTNKTKPLVFVCAVLGKKSFNFWLLGTN